MYRVGECAKHNSDLEKWEKPLHTGYEVVRILEVGKEKYRYCHPLIQTEAQRNGVHSPISSLYFRILDDTTHEIPCPPYKK
jgi:hypothetical protein